MNQEGVCLIKKDNEGNLLAIDLSTNDNRITLVDIYGRNFGCLDSFEQPDERVRDCSIDFDNNNFTLCGKFNRPSSEH